VISDDNGGTFAVLPVMDKRSSASGGPEPPPLVVSVAFLPPPRSYRIALASPLFHRVALLDAEFPHPSHHFEGARLAPLEEVGLKDSGMDQCADG